MATKLPEDFSRFVIVTAETANRERVDSRSLLGPQGKLIIAHDDEDYQLRITKAGKLILTK